MPTARDAFVCQLYCKKFDRRAISVIDMDTAGLLWTVLFSSLGLGFFVYGKQQKAVVPLVCGLGLMTYPYFVSNVIMLVAIGCVFVAVPYFIRI